MDAWVDVSAGGVVPLSPTSSRNSRGGFPTRPPFTTSQTNNINTHHPNIHPPTHPPHPTQLPSMAAGDERRKKRQREELEAAASGRAAAEQALLNPEQERMRRPVAWGFKEKEGALATPDYLPSFMEVRFFVSVRGWCGWLGWLVDTVALLWLWWWVGWTVRGVDLRLSSSDLTPHTHTPPHPLHHKTGLPAAAGRAGAATPAPPLRRRGRAHLRVADCRGRRREGGKRRQGGLGAARGPRAIRRRGRGARAVPAAH
jgi:hypothetical protein